MNRPRILDVAIAARSYVTQAHDEIDATPTSSAHELQRDGDTLEIVGAELGLTRERARQIEAIALAKLRVAFELEQELGIVGAAPVLEHLRGHPLSHFAAALARARGEGE